MGAYTVSVGVADHDDGSSAAGGTIAAFGSGTLTLVTQHKHLLLLVTQNFKW